MRVTLIDEQEYSERVAEDLDNINPPVRIGSLKYRPSRVLQAIDPIAWRCLLCECEDQFVERGVYCSGRHIEGYDYHICRQCGATYDCETEARICCDPYHMEIAQC